MVQSNLAKLGLGNESIQLATPNGASIPVKDDEVNLSPQFMEMGIFGGKSKKDIAAELEYQAEKIIDGAFDQAEGASDEEKRNLGGLIDECEHALVELKEDPEGYVDRKMNNVMRDDD